MVQRFYVLFLMKSRNIRKYDKTRYLTLFYSEIFNGISNRIRHLTRLKSNISIVYYQNTKVAIDSDDNLP